MYRTIDFFRKVVVFGALCVGVFRVSAADDYTYQSLTNLGPCASSRVLLMNNDTNPICPIQGQGYHDTDSNTVAVGQTYWWHDDTPLDEMLGTTPVSDLMNLQIGSTHILYQRQSDIGSPIKLWELIECRAGSSAMNLAANFNYLPWSSTCQPIDPGFYTVPPKIPDEWNRGAYSNGMRQVAVITMRATVNGDREPLAKIYSPLYKEGIGDIYFDIVNFTRSFLNSHIAVEIAKTLISTGEATSFEDETDWAKFNWERVPCEVYKVNKNGTFELDSMNLNATKVLLHSSAGYDNQYYRVRVPVNYHAPVRFRIIRPDIQATTYKDYQDIISLDNIVVSYPVPESRLLPTGIEADGTGKANIGRVGAFTEPLLSVGLTGVKPRMSFSAETNGLPSFIDWKVKVDHADVIWRWHYLDQAFGLWKTNTLSMAESGEEMVANDSITVTNVTGDLEYYYVANVMGTHYKYFDFANDTPIDPFTDATGFALLRYPDEEHNKEKGETNYWSRIREGASPWQEMHLVSEVYTNADMTASVTNDWTMELIGDRTWRGFVSTPTNYAGRSAHITFVGKNFWETNAVAPSVSSQTWYFPPSGMGDEEIEIPMGGVAFTDLGGKDERDVKLDASTGYLMFEFKDDDGSFTLNRAEYQDFNLWTPKDGKENFYLGDSEFTNGVSSAKQVYAFDLSSLPESQASSAFWWENFDQKAGVSDYPFNEPFGQNRITPNGWIANNGMFINGMFSAVTNRDTFGMALQLQGRGIGSISLIDPIKVPNGIGTVSFSARLAQYLSFEDFYCYQDGGGSRNYAISAKAAMTSQKDLYSDISTGSPSLSLINYYRASKGCYEFRITRVYGDRERYGTRNDNDGVMEMTIYKWYVAIDPVTKEESWVYKQLKSLRLGNNAALVPAVGRQYTNGSNRVNFDNYLVPKTTLTNTNNVPDNTYWTSVYFAAYNTSTGTYLEGGLCGRPTDAVDARTDITDNINKRMMSISVTDNEKDEKGNDVYFKKGTYGVCSRECPAAFGNIQKHDLFGAGPYSNGRNSNNFGVGNKSVEDGHFSDGEWGSPAKGRMTTFKQRRDSMDGKNYYARYDYGACTTPLSQQLFLRYANHGDSSNWRDSGLKLTLTSYVSTNVVFAPHTTSSANIQIAVGGDQSSARTDAVVDDLQLSQWSGESSPLTLLGSLTDWAYTDAWVSGTTNDVYQSAGASTNSDNSIAFISDCGFYSYKVEGSEDEYIYVFTNTVDGAYSGYGGYANFTPKSDITVEEVFVLGGGGGGGPGGGGGGGGSALWITNAVDYYAGESGLQIFVGPGGSGGVERYSNAAITPTGASTGVTSYVRMKNPLSPTGDSQLYCGYGGGSGGAFHKTATAGINGTANGGAGGGSACRNTTRAKGFEIYGAGYGGAANNGAPGGGGGGLRGIGDGGGNSASGNADDPRSVIAAGSDGSPGASNGGKGGNGFPISVMGDSPIRSAIGKLLGNNNAWLGGGGGGGSGKNTTSATVSAYGNGADSPGPGGNGGGGKGGDHTIGSYNANYQNAMGRSGAPFTGGGGGGGAFKNPVTSGSSAANNWILGGGAGGSGLVVLRVKMKNKFVLLQPMRGDENDPMSVRTLFMDGISLLGFSWRNADANAKLYVQIATNDVNRQTVGELTTGFKGWTDICAINFATMSDAVRASGSTNISIGLRSPICGLVRVMMDRDVVSTARLNATNDLFDTMYGAVSITAMRVLDEPPLDDRSWWGWNIMPSQQALYASLYDRDDLIPGRSCALNFTGVKDVANHLFANPDGEYSLHDPFVQTPRFTNSIGQVMFKARILETNLVSSRSGWVTISGCKDPRVDKEGDTNWEVLTNIEVTTDTTIFKPYQWRIPQAYSEYQALRLSTYGAAKGRYNQKDSGEPFGDGGTKNPVPVQRVLLDEVLVLQPMRPGLQFKNAYPFRRNVDYAAGSENYGCAISNHVITGTSAQPLLNEEFGMQVQIVPAGMVDELDTDSIEVYMDWYVGLSPWGAQNWINEPLAVKNVRLVKAKGASDGTLIYRSDPDDISAFIPAQQAGDNGYQVVQYRIWARYKDKNGNQQDPHEITGSEWATPGWYDPIDFNKTGGGAFSAYTILDTISPKRAWFNEINMYQYGDLADEVHQYIEIAAPQGYDLTGWSVSAIQQGGGYVLMPLVDLGYNGVAVNPKNAPATGNYVFYGIQSPQTKAAGTYDSKNLDGAWKATAFNSGKENVGRACALRLLRPSKIIEHELVFMCTNTSTSRMAWTYDGTNFLKLVRENVEIGNADPWFYAGADGKAGASEDYSLGVYTEHGEENTWTNEMVQTPGEVNRLANGAYQEIDPNYFDPPTGTNLWIYATVDVTWPESQAPWLSMKVGETNVTAAVLIVPQVAGSFTTSIVYKAQKWFDIDSIVTNMAGAAGGKVSGPFVKAADGTWTFKLANFKLGDSSSRRFYVRASAKNSSKIPDEEHGGISSDDPYYPAVVDWLQNYEEGDIKLAWFYGLDDHKVSKLSLKEMYWLDIPPVSPNSTDEDSEWVFKAGMGSSNDNGATAVGTIPSYTEDGAKSTNVLVTVTMMISNRCDATKKPYPPYTLRGLEPGSVSSNYNEYAANGSSWTSVTFKVKGALQNGKVDHTFKPLRWFTFGPDSFGAPGTANAFSRTIELHDPFSKASPGYTYDWDKYPGTPIFYRCAIDEELGPVTVYPLNDESALLTPTTP